MTQTVLILGGSGKIGSRAAEAFWNAGWNVRQYDRKSNDMTAAAMGADVIVNGLNPPKYNDWARNIPAITKQVIEAAKASGASVILPGNIYNFGAYEGEMDDTTPQQPHTRKGRIRVEMEAAYRASGVQTIVLRAGNFIDPDGNGDIMSMMLLRDAGSRKITAAGRTSIPQAYCYTPDWGRAAQMLAEKRGELAQFQDVPFPGHTFTLEELKTTLEDETGAAFKFSRFPWWAITLIAPFSELMRELREMRYQYDLPHWIGSETFKRLLPEFQPTPLREVMCAGLPAEVYPNQTMRTGGKTVAAE